MERIDVAAALIPRSQQTLGDKIFSAAINLSISASLVKIAAVTRMQEPQATPARATVKILNRLRSAAARALFCASPVWPRRRKDVMPPAPIRSR
jgi:hypothetical protein